MVLLTPSPLFGRHQTSGLWKRIKDEWIVVSLCKDERPNCLKDLRTWGSCNIGLEGIRLDNCQWKEGVFIVVLASMNLTECHTMTIPWDPMCGLHIVPKEHNHQAIYKFIEEAEACHRSSARVCQFNWDCNEVTLFVEVKSLKVHQAARLWTISTLWVLSLVWRSHTAEAYSSWEWTRDW